MKQKKPSQFGGKITKELEETLSSSANWKDGRFQNLIETKLSFSPFLIPKIIYKQIAGASKRIPKGPLPIIDTKYDDFLQREIAFVWYGHSVLLLRIGGKTILIDPMFGSDASPIAPTTTKRFSDNTMAIIDKLPEIDLVIFTHDHYDHLDLGSFLKLRKKVKFFYTAIGVKRHLVAWGEDQDKIKEFDWWQSEDFAGIKITFTPSRHFGGRGLFDRQKSFWGGWVFEHKDKKIWLSGDGGYGPHFKEIGERLGPFDLAFMECGQYNEDWKPVHLFPNEAVQAAIEGKVKKAMPIHWAGFALSYQHTWEQPVEEFVKFANEAKLEGITPRLGEIFDLNTKNTAKWWEEN